MLSKISMIHFNDFAVSRTAMIYLPVMQPKCRVVNVAFPELEVSLEPSEDPIHDECLGLYFLVVTFFCGCFLACRVSTPLFLKIRTNVILNIFDV